MIYVHNIYFPVFCSAGQNKINLFNETTLGKITKDQRHLGRVSYFSEVSRSVCIYFLFTVYYTMRNLERLIKLCTLLCSNFFQSTFTSVILILFLTDIRAYYSHFIYKKVRHNYIVSQWQCLG